jgi:hypothetical protein
VSRHTRISLLIVLVATAVAGWSAPGEAQGFRGRRVVVGPRPVFVGGYYADPFWLYDPWFGFGYPYPIGPYPPYRYYNLDSGGSIRLEVRPKQAEVYVDGYYAGIVDDFDGSLQRLHVAPGEHDIALFLDGYRTVHQKIYLTPDNTFRLKYVMERLAAGDQAEARPQPMNPPPQQQAGPGQPPMYPPQGRGPVGRRQPQGPPPQGAPQGAPPDMRRGGDASAYGSLAIRVQPGGADVLIDGETWHGPESQDRLFVDVAEGSHTIEIRKAGYRNYLAQVQVRRGETTQVNVSLRTQEQP